VTPERLEVTDFTAPWVAGVDEIVVTRPVGPVITTVEDLSGNEVFVRESSSYYRSLAERAADEGRQTARDDHTRARGTRRRRSP
jgi:hypothetical protein